MTKINQEEYRVLKGLNSIWKWIAKDKNTALWVYKEEPRKYHEDSWDEYSSVCEEIDSALFQFIKWEDSEPYNISELIEEYEYSANHVSHVLNERVEALGNAWKESEKTEVKSKQELIEKWNLAIESAEFYGKGKEDRLIEYMRDFVGDLKQLDEPEITELDALNRLAENVQFSAHEIASHLEKLSAYNGKVTYGDQEILVTKQDLPVIPQHVASYLNIVKRDITLMRALEIANRRSELPKWEKEYDWISSNDETFARAWLDGFTAEEEQKYYVLNTEGETMIRKNDSGVGTSLGFKIKNWLNDESYKLTEQEIKDYDERYWPFRRKVEELEE